MSDSVGYGKPPVETRFQKGRSGNPKGRPKGSKNVQTIIRQVGREKVRITENGRTRSVTKNEAVVQRCAAKAMAGDHKAMQQFFALSSYAEDSTQFAVAAMPQDEKRHDVLALLAKRIRMMESPDESISPNSNPEPQEGFEQ